ncbi:hypothetical protein IFR05_001607 [Cadophora sp. M221]|nr:hypothetical protein IFR05_001607 [Cadophora sp. M221]
MDPNSLGDFQASQGSQGDFSGGTQMLLPIDFDVNWSLWMDMDAMSATDMGHGLGMMDDWGGAESRRKTGLSVDQPRQTLSHHQSITFQPLSLWTHHNYGADEFGRCLGSDLSPSTLATSPMSVDDNGPPSIPSDRQLTSICKVSQTDDPNIHSSIASVSLTSKRPKVPKSRIRCSYSGCKLTFPRNYELRRHQDGVHNPTIAVFCPFFECDRAVEPFPRKDKAREHMRKHQNVQHFICIFKDCRSSPWSKEELLSHLNGQHKHGQRCAESEAIALGFFQWRQTPLRDGLFLFESQDNCPLAFLGCKLTGSKSSTINHLGSHELVDRSRGFEAIAVVVASFWVCRGIATCPICREQVCAPADYIDQLVTHIKHHSKEERGVHAFELAEMFRPFLSQQLRWDHWASPVADFGKMIEAELQEAGVISKTMG